MNPATALSDAEMGELEQLLDSLPPPLEPLDISALDEDSLSPSDLTLPWVAGFAAAMDHFNGLMAIDHPGLLEPLAVLYAVFDPDDLEDADELLAVIETLEPPTTLAEAVEDLVRSVLLLADVSRPRSGPGPQRPGKTRPGRQRPGGRRVA